MKLTQSKRDWVMQKVNHYCSLLKVESPTVFFTMSEYDRWKIEQRRKTGFVRVGRSNVLGVCHRISKFIVVLVKRHADLEDLDKTIRHELIHYTKPGYWHGGPEFRDRMERLKRGDISATGRFS